MQRQCLGSGTGPLDSESREPLLDLETQSRGLVPDPELT